MKLIPVLLFVLLGIACAEKLHEDAQNSGRVASGQWSTTICGQEWMTLDLDVVAYRNGDPIPEVQDPSQWTTLTTGAWCWYNNDSRTGSRLYNWYAVNDPRGLAPVGWHVPSDTEWSSMESCLRDSVGYRMRMAGTAHWPGPSTVVDNSSGFSGLPSGIRSDGGSFSEAGRMAVYWTTVDGSESDAWCGRLIHYVNNKGLPWMVTGVGYMNKMDGYSVRCVKDSVHTIP